jgi:hypothetical protein
VGSVKGMQFSESTTSVLELCAHLLEHFPAHEVVRRDDFVELHLLGSKQVWVPMSAIHEVTSELGPENEDLWVDAFEDLTVLVWTYSRT